MALVLKQRMRRKVGLRATELEVIKAMAVQSLVLHHLSLDLSIVGENLGLF